MSFFRFSFIVMALGLIPQLAVAQIVNIESLRSFADTSGFHGIENFNVSYTRNTRELLKLTNNLSLKYKEQRHTWLFLNTLDVSLANKTVLEKNLFLHLRYNYRQNDWLTYEVFSQYQKDVPLRIENRMLAGIGPRFTLANKKRAKVFLGTLGMYEHDEELNTGTTNRAVRLSSYLSFTYGIEEKLNWANYIYYQPRVDRFEDFRTSVQSQLQVLIWKSLSFTTTLTLAYDAFPVPDPAIPNLTVKWTNGISYTF